MDTIYQERFAVHIDDFKHYTTEKIRAHFLIPDVMQDGKISLVYSHYDRLIVGGAVPVKKPLMLEPIDLLKSTFFLERREMGIINVGGRGKILTINEEYTLENKEALYLGRDTQKVIFESADPAKPAHFYINSAPAHVAYPNRHVTLEQAERVDLGSLETSNARRINKLLVNTVIQTCQLQMGMTELKPGSVWNTMPCHTHSRRMEAYFYFNVPEKQAVCHFMGHPYETRPVWMTNEQAVLSPPWSIHAAAGTSNYTFIWGMAGENLEYTDMDAYQPGDLK
ncbi:MAG: 5-dehydro-4-deoxy-D-glucuronate isomerase [Bacteroidales bacterium]|nr:5-dehydro-4-deoxy-D-glucuronate isomerase [Bacteroidales bacterium]